MASRIPIIAIISAALFASAAVYALEGVVEINQVRATAGGVTAGDTAGFPVTISVSGSYRLTSNLTMPDENTHGVEITGAKVTLDLNGFTIQGPSVCGAFVCSPTGTGLGVVSSQNSVTNTNCP